MIGILKSKEEIAIGTLSVSFEVNEPFTFRAGQYCFITLNELKYPDERGPKRHFSINESSNQKGTITFTTRLSESGFKKSLNELTLGSEVQLGPVAGAFVLPEDTTRPLVFIAGGIGITPFISMLRYISEEKLPYNISLIYSNRDQESTAFFDEVSSFKLSVSSFKLIMTMTKDPQWSGEKRMVNAQFIKDYFPDVNSQYYMVVGPPPMIEAVTKELAKAEVASENIKIEKFTGY